MRINIDPRIKDILWALVLGLLLGTILFCCSGCTSKRVVVEERVHDTIVKVRTDTLTDYRYTHRTDTLRENHIFTFVVDEEGNIRHTKEVHDTYRSTTDKDSTNYYRSRCDSLTERLTHLKPQIVEVEKKLSFIDTIRIRYFDFFIILLIVSFLVNVLLIKKR